MAQVLTGTSPLDLDILGSYEALTSAYHQITVYSRDADALAARVGIDLSRP